VYIDRALLDVHVSSPDLVEELVAAVSPLRVRHEKTQQVEFRRPHVQGLLAEENAPALRVQHQVRHLHAIRIFAATRAAQEGANTGDEFTRCEGLGDVIVRSDVQPLDHVVFRGLGRQHDHRQFAGRVIALKAPQQFYAAAAGQHPVQEHDVRALVDNQGVRILYVVRLQAAKVHDLQGHAQHVADSHLVVYHQYGALAHDKYSGCCSRGRRMLQRACDTKMTFGPQNDTGTS
jgi:hypothetical protein